MTYGGRPATAEEQGEHVRLRCGCSAPPLVLTPSRCARAALVTPAGWSALFEYRFRALDHIYMHELTALTSLVKHLANRSKSKNPVLPRQPRRPRGSLKRALLLKTSQFRAPETGIRMSPCVFVNRFILGPIAGKPCRRSLARYLAGQLKTFTSDPAASRCKRPFLVNRCCP